MVATDEIIPSLQPDEFDGGKDDRKDGCGYGEYLQQRGIVKVFG